MFGILQRYVTKELFKTFALTAVGLTLLFSLCGGVLNMVQIEVIGSLQVAKIMGIVVPIAATLTLPVAALFACAMVYGRLASDNEFDACRASGVNITRLLAPAMLLSMFTFAFTFLSTNYMIPGFVARLDAMLQKDVQKIMLQALVTQGYIKYKTYTVYAGRSPTILEEGDNKSLDIRNAAFLEIEGERLIRCGTADRVKVNFRSDGSGGAPVVDAAMFDVRALDAARKQFYELQYQPFEPREIPLRFEQDPKWLTLNDLFYYRRVPIELPGIRDKIADLRWLMDGQLFYKRVGESLKNGGTLSLTDGKVTYEITAQRVVADREDTHEPTLHDVKIRERGENLARDYEAAGLVMTLREGLLGGPPVVNMSLENGVTFIDQIDPDNRIELRRTDLQAMPMPAEFVAPERELPDMALVGEPPAFTRDLRTRVANGFVSLKATLEGQQREVISIIHSRLAFSASVLVMLVLAAALGIIFRGGQVLTAFVISFIPGLLVVGANIAGRPMAEKDTTHLAGLIVTWSALVLVALADGVVLTRYLKR